MTSLIGTLGSVFGNTASTTASGFAATVLQQMAVGGLAAAGLAALQHPDVKAALLPFDPLGLASKPLVPAPVAAPVAPAPVAPAPVAPAPVAMVGPKTLTAANVLALGWTIAQAEANGYTVAG
jgi:hypothetical protein